MLNEDERSSKESWTATRSDWISGSSTSIWKSSKRTSPEFERCSIEFSLNVYRVVSPSSLSIRGHLLIHVRSEKGKSVFKKWLSFEKEHGDAAGMENVKTQARAFVESRQE